MEKIVEVDVSQLEDFIGKMPRIKGALLIRLGERGGKHLRDEVPVGRGNLKQGVSPPDIQGDSAILTVSARSGMRGPRSATVYSKDGKTKQVTLKPASAYNYAPSVALGRRAYETKKGRIERTGNKAIGPGFNRALIIPVKTAPKDESYLVMDGQIYIFRTKVKAKAGNPFHVRAAKKLGGESVGIANALIEKVLTDGK